MRVLRFLALGLVSAPLVASAQLFVELDQTSGGYNYKATADFDYMGSILTLVLTNTQTSNAVQAGNAQVLTGLFWDMNVAATGVGATKGSSLFVDGAGNLTNPAPETEAQHWAWKSGVPNLPINHSTNFGVGAAGFNHFGNADAFAPGGSNPVLNGVDWGLVGGNWDINGNQSPLIMSSMTFTFNVGTNFDINSIDHVVFQYGSGFNEFQGWDPEFPPEEAVPEPASIAMIAFAGIAVWARRKRNS